MVGVTVNSVADMEFVIQEINESDCCQSAVWLVSVNSKAEMEFVSQEKPKVIVVGQQSGWCHSQ